MKITYGQSVHGKEEIEAVVKTIKKSTQMGENVDKFERKIAKILNKKNGVMVNSGSSALYLSNKIIQLPKNSQVITPVLTFATTVSSLLQNNLIPSFIDVELDTYCIDANKIEKQINKNTKAICVPNLIGNLPNWKKIRKIANKHNLIVIEDSADTLGAKIDNKYSGYYSDISITSFYGSHVINCAGNGGMLCASNQDWIRDAKILRSWGRSSSILKNSENIRDRLNYKLGNINYDAKFVFEKVGYNFEPSEIGAAFGLVQLKNLNKNSRIRKRNFNKHLNFISNYEDIFIKPKILKGVSTNFLAFPLQIKNNNKIKRKNLQLFLEEKGIQTRVIFTGNILRQPGFKKIKYHSIYNNFNNADNIMKNGILIGCHHGLSEKSIDTIHKTIKTFIDKFY